MEPNSHLPAALGEMPLPRLVKETELQHLLTDEKLRSEQHKLNFQALKTEHDRLQDEYKKMQIHVKQLTNDNHQIKESCKSMLQQYKKELVQKQAELEETRKDVITPQQLGLIRLNLQEEIEKSYHERFAALEEEAEQYRSTSNKLRYDFMFLKTEYQRMEQEHQRVQEETTLKFQAEIGRLNEERSNLQSALEVQKKNESTVVVGKLQQENLEMKHRLKLLQDAMDEAKAQKDHSASHASSLQNLQLKQLADHAAKVRGLEMEKSSLNAQLESVQAETRKSLNAQADQAMELKQAQQKVKELLAKLQDAEYKSRIDAADAQMKMLKQKGEVERERDQLASELAGVKNDLEMTQQQLHLQGRLMQDAEEEASRRLRVMQDEEWKKLQKVEAEKLQLETRLEELEQQQLDHDLQHKAAIAAVEEKHRVWLQEKDKLETELERMKSKHERVASQLEDFERHQQVAESFRSGTRNLQLSRHDIEHALTLEQEENKKLKKELDDMRMEMNKLQTDHTRQVSLHDTALLHQQLSWEENKRQFQSRISSLENQLTHARQKYNGENQTAKAKLKKYRKMMMKLRDSSRLLKAKVEELEVEKEILKRNVPQEVHRMLQKQLRDLKRRLNEFHSVMLAGDASAVSLPTVASSRAQRTRKQLAATASAFALTNETEKEIEDVKNRMKVLDCKQRKQLMVLEKDSGHNADDEDSTDSRRSDVTS